jgi:hypothetical protein
MRAGIAPDSGASKSADVAYVAATERQARPFLGSMNAPSSRAQVPDSNRVFGVETDSGVEPFAVEGVFDPGQRAV